MIIRLKKQSKEQNKHKVKKQDRLKDIFEASCQEKPQYTL